MTKNDQPMLDIDVQISTRDVDAWRQMAADLSEEILALEERREHLLKRVDIALSLFAMVSGAEDYDRSPRSRRSAAEPSMIDTVGEAIRSAGKLSMVDLKEIIANGPLGKRLKKSEQGFHHGISRLADRGEIVRHNGWLFSKAGYNEFVDGLSRGEIEDLPAPTNRPSPIADAIIDVLGKSPSGLSTPDLMNILADHPASAESIQRNKTSVYNIISRLTKRGKIKKDGNFLSLTED